MRKILLLIAAVAMVLPSCKKIEESIDALENRIEVLENETIPTIDEQIAAINLSLDALEKADEDLNGYIRDLEAVAADLQEQINDTNTKIDEVKTALQNEISTAKTEVLAKLDAVKTELEAELVTINATIETLKAKDEELGKKIDDLKSYVDTELGKTTDWVNATFATLEQYNAIVAEVTAIKAQIEAINKSIADLETRLTTKINEDIAAAVAALNTTIQQKVKEITDAYTAAINGAKDELTAAYTAAIATAISNLETFLKAWVGEQLSGYYTIAEIDAKIIALEKAIADGDKALQEELNTLKSQLESAKKELTESYQKAIEEAITTNNGVINAKIASEIAAVNKRIDEAVAAINAKIAAIEARLDNVEAQVKDLLARIQSVSYIPKYSDGKATIIYDGVKSQITLDFEISPKDAVAELAKVWQSALNLKAVYTETRAVPFVDMPIFSFEADTQNGVISVTASGENLSAPFFADMQEASVRLAISDGNSSVASEYIPMVVHHIAFLDSHNACIETWYEDYNTSSMLLDGSTIYVDNIRLTGDITSDNVLALGVIVTDDDTFSKAATQSATLEISPIQISGLTSGVYTVRPYAKIFINGEVLELFGEQTAKIVTSIPTLSCRVRTSYTINGNVVKDNSVPGDAVEITVNISDSYIAENLVDGSKWVAGNYSGTIGNSTIYSNMIFGKYIFSIKATLQNGYMLEENDIEAYITGIPYILNTRSNDGWSTTGSVEWNTDGGVRLGYNSNSDSHMAKNFYVPEDIPVLVENTGTIMGMTANSSSYHLVVGNTTYSISNTTLSSAESWNITPPEILLTASNARITMYSKSKYPVLDYVTIKGLTVIYAPDDI